MLQGPITISGTTLSAPAVPQAVIDPGAKAILSEFDDFASHYEVLLEAADRQ